MGRKHYFCNKMDKDNRKYRFCFIDYMWYVAAVSYTHLTLPTKA